jgi:hypothetical protein
MANGNVRGSGVAIEPTPNHKSPAEIVIPKRWLRAKEAAAYLGLSVPHMSRMRELRVGPRYRKHGVVVLYDVVDLDAYCEILPLVETAGGGA